MLFVTALGLFAPAIVRGQQTPIIRSIDVQYLRSATVSKDVILAQIRTAVGQPYSDSTVEDDIAVSTRPHIQNVRIFAQPEEDGVKVIVAVQTRQVLRELVIDGAQRVSAKKLRKEIGVKLNSPVNEDDLQKRAKRSSTGIKARVSPTLPWISGSSRSTKAAGRRGSFTRSTKA